MNIIKTCSKCGQKKPLNDFVKDNRRQDGHSTICKECKRAYDRDRYAKLKENPAYHQRKLCSNARYKALHKQHIQNYSSEYNSRPDVIARKSDWYYSKTKHKSIPSKIKDMVTRAKHRADNKGVPFAITSEDVAYTDVCPILEITLNWEGGARDSNTPSLDRVIPELGYVPGNVRIVSNLANMMKSSATIEQLRIFTKNIINYMESKDIVRTVENTESTESKDKEP